MISLNPWAKKNVSLPERNLEDIQRICNILFVDDQEFGVVEILKNNIGWRNTNRISDIDSLDQKEVREAHIIFVDIQGVGQILTPSEEGLGLIREIKTRYPNKRVIVYSAESEGDRLHPAFDFVDARLRKNADMIQFQHHIEKYAREAFSRYEFIERVREVLRPHLGYTPEADKVIADIEKIVAGKKTDSESVARAFNLKNAAQAANLIATLINVYFKTNGE